MERTRSITTTITAGTTKDLIIRTSGSFHGKIKTISVKGLLTISYNHLNLPSIVSKSSDQQLNYIYDATGKKLCQQASNVSSSLAKKTDYCGEFFYENDTLKFINHEEGRVIMTEGAPEYQYHLKDHLGNVRMTFTTKDEVESNTATLEASNLTGEQSKFLRYETARKIYSSLFDKTNGSSLGYSERLNGTANEKYGIARSLSVMPGDTVKMEVFTKYVDQNSSNLTQALTDFLAAIASGTAPSGTVIDGAGYANSTSSFSYAGLLNTSNSSGNGPKAYLNWLIFGRNYNLLNGGYQRMSDTAKEQGQDVAHEKLSSEILIKEPGYVYIYLSNENETPVEVFFDDLKVEHRKSPIISSTDYYPFYAPFNSYSRENSVPQKFLYQGKEWQEDLSINLYDFHWRQYDPYIPRTTTLDPHADSYYSLSPYSWAANNPMNVVDPDGRDIINSGFATSYTGADAQNLFKLIQAKENAKQAESQASSSFSFSDGFSKWKNGQRNGGSQDCGCPNPPCDDGPWIRNLPSNRPSNESEVDRAAIAAETGIAFDISVGAGNQSLLIVNKELAKQNLINNLAKKSGVPRTAFSTVKFPLLLDT